MDPYARIDTESDEIRLIEILPGNFDDYIELHLRVASLQRDLDYDALSYVWKPLYGMSGKEVAPVIVKGQQDHRISIGENLDAALRHLRHPKEARIMWIDALSINQANVRERNHQVALMGKIYSCAQSVIIWLGTSQEDSDFVIDSMASGELK
ncbi:hypothetical protein CC80DRAFT_464631 [Byssothecium circinans]|uniref:Heterokaryon incompatibility domain-containing protein n=1 Tax=Byssothecium circinans TaxID=147558 RepID=A0A6A5U762_9PLEO|nr:hypothetical protein CC80DRAFT_464631 [Byssothecium circinans]